MPGLTDTVVNTAGSAAQKVASDGLANDPGFIKSLIINSLIKDGKTKEEATDILNAYEGKFKGTTTASEAINGTIGTEFIQGYTKDVILASLIKNLGLQEEQAKKALDIFSTLSGQLNQAHLGAEQTKISAQVGMYSSAGSLLGTFYGFGALVDAIAPGTATKFLESIEKYMNIISDKIENESISPASKDIFVNAYSAARANVAGTDVFNPATSLRQGAPIAGDTVDKSGKSKIASEMTGNATSAADQASVPTVTPQGGTSNPFAGVKIGGSSKAAGFAGVKIEEPAPQ